MMKGLRLIEDEFHWETSAQDQLTDDFTVTVDVQCFFTDTNRCKKHLVRNMKYTDQYPQH